MSAGPDYGADLLRTARRSRLSARDRAYAACAFLHRSKLPVEIGAVLDVAGGVSPEVAEAVVAEYGRDPLSANRIRGAALRVSSRGARIARGG